MKKLISVLIFVALAAALGTAQISDTRIPQGQGYISLTSTCSNANTSCDTLGTTVFDQRGDVIGPQTLEFNTISYGLAVIYVNGNSTAVGSTISFEFSDDGGISWYQNVCTRTDTNIQESSEAVPASTYRAWDCGVGAATRMRVRQTAISSGSLNISATLTAGLVEPAPTVALVGTDPCQSSAVAKQTAFANITTATTTALVPVSGTTNVYVCGAIFTSISATSPNTAIFEQGTGATCAGSPTSLVGTLSFPVGSGSNTPWGFGGMTLFKTTAGGNGICLVSTVGATPSLNVTITYVQQ